VPISEREALDLVQTVAGREPDHSGHYMENFRVQTSTGTALIRRPRKGVPDRFDPRMMPEAAALKAALARGVQAPELLYEGETFLIERFIDGSTPRLADTNGKPWMTNLLNQIRRLHAASAPTSDLGNVYEWQLWLQKFLDGLYTSLPAAHAERVTYLRIPSLDEFWSPDPRQGDRALVLAHSDLHPSNLLLNDAGVWILDWELAMTADPVWEAGVSLHRTPWSDFDAESQACSMWLGVLSHAIRSTQITELLDQYRALETWKSLVVDSWRFPEAITAELRASRFHRLLSVGVARFGCIDSTLDDVRDLLLQWADN
jgi:aminoglycoside phosphotransferase (APT) family kinase protein